MKQILFYIQSPNMHTVHKQIYSISVILTFHRGGVRAGMQPGRAWGGGASPTEGGLEEALSR